MKTLVIATLAVLLLSALSPYTGVSTWNLTTASRVWAFRTETGVVIVAEVQLLPGKCYQAEVQRDPGKTPIPLWYAVTARADSSVAGKYCSVRAFGAFDMNSAPATVTVYSANEVRHHVPVATLADLLHSPKAFATLTNDGFQFVLNQPPASSNVVYQVRALREQFLLPQSLVSGGRGGQQQYTSQVPQGAVSQNTSSSAQNPGGAAGAQPAVTQSPTPSPGPLPANPPLNLRRPTMFTIGLGGDSATNSRLAIEMASQLELQYPIRGYNHWIVPEPGWTISNFINQCSDDPRNTSGAVVLVPIATGPTDSYLLITRSWTQLDLVAYALDCEPPGKPATQAPTFQTFFMSMAPALRTSTRAKVEVTVTTPGPDNRTPTGPPAPSPVHVRWVTGVATGIGSRSSVQLLPLAALATAIYSLVGKSVVTTMSYAFATPSPLPAAPASYPTGSSIVTTQQAGAGSYAGLLGASFLSQFQSSSVTVGSPIAADTQLFHAAHRAIAALMTDGDWGLKGIAGAGWGVCPPSDTGPFCIWFRPIDTIMLTGSAETIMAGSTLSAVTNLSSNTACYFINGLNRQLVSAGEVLDLGDSPYSAPVGVGKALGGTSCSLELAYRPPVSP